MKVAIALALAIVLAAIGDILFSKGMKANGEVNLRGIGDIFHLIKQVIRNPLILAGAFSMALHLTAYISALAWIDVSVANPLTALSYVIATGYAAFFMREKVDASRWAGVCFVTIGAILVGLSS